MYSTENSTYSRWSEWILIQNKACQLNRFIIKHREQIQRKTGLCDFSEHTQRLKAVFQQSTQYFASREKSRLSLDTLITINAENKITILAQAITTKHTATSSKTEYDLSPASKINFIIYQTGEDSNSLYTHGLDTHELDSVGITKN